MKIYIGPYRNWIGPYQIAEKILFWMDKAKDSRVHNFGEWLAKSDTLCRICEWTYSKKKRKTKIRIDKYDTWNMDHTLALIVLPMLKQLRDTKHGSPLVDDEDVPEHYRSTVAEPKENEWDSDSNFFKRWDWVLEEMIYAFEKELDEEWEMEIYKREPEGWDDEKFAERKIIQDRIANGFRLFGKYYQGLWD
jgi:hypothetical protein